MQNIVNYDVEVTPLTMAVLSQETETGELGTHILDERLEYIVQTTPTKIIENACKYYGSTLEGRLDGTRGISKFVYKPPIAIDPSSGMFFFPTSSPKHKTCSWIAHSHIAYINPKHNQRETEIIFKNGRNILLPVSYGSINNQVQRTAQFRYDLETRLPPNR